jgi:DNA-binding response OmpR family regulator
MTTDAKRILLVEDDRHLRRACEASLRQSGFTVITAADGVDGLRAAAEVSPDLILLDLLLPRMSGLDVLRRAKANPTTREIPVLVISNSSRPQDVEELMRLGAVDYLVKSNLSLRELTDRVVEVLGIDPRVSTSAPGPPGRLGASGGLGGPRPGPPCDIER